MIQALARPRRSSIRQVLALVLLPMAGCGGDADRSRIASGTVASVYGVTGQSVPVFFSEKTERLAVGSRVLVVSDREEDDPSRPDRKVVVSIQAGPWRGMAAQMNRSDLRP
jgi:hypothetical protein